MSKFMFAMLNMVGALLQVVGVLVYERFLKRMEVRTVLIINVLINITSNFFALTQAKRWNLEFGLSDYFFCWF